MNDEIPVLSAKERRALKQRAHHLNPVVMIGQHGVSDALVRECDTALDAHELIKVRILDGDRAERAEIAETLCRRLNAALVAHLGKLLIVWRKKTETSPP